VTTKRSSRLLLGATLIAAIAVVATTVAQSEGALPSWPAGAVLAYKCSDSLCLVAASGGGERKLLATARPWPQWDPAFSPDGREIAFRGYYQPGADGAYALYVAPINGCTKAKRLTRGVAGDPAWSPDGRWIAFVLDQRHGSEIWLMHPDGSDKHRLHTDAAAVDESLAWSHDGRWLAFDRTTTNYGTMAAIRADGSDTHTLTSRPPTWNPVWLPSDTGIAYLAGTANSNGTIAGGRLYVMRSDGTGKHPVAGPRTIQFASTAGTLAPRRCG
jgi:Tol biopolymer transport system component